MTFPLSITLIRVTPFLWSERVRGIKKIHRMIILLDEVVWTSNRYFVLAFECAGLSSSIKGLFLGAKLV
jgi:hypothetical protein